MKKIRFIALIAAIAAFCTGCGYDVTDTESKNEVKTSATATAETTAETTSSDNTATSKMKTAAFI